MALLCYPPYPILIKQKDLDCQNAYKSQEKHTEVACRTRSMYCCNLTFFSTRHDVTLFELYARTALKESREEQPHAENESVFVAVALLKGTLKSMETILLFLNLFTKIFPSGRKIQY